MAAIRWCPCTPAIRRSAQLPIALLHRDQGTERRRWVSPAVRVTWQQSFKRLGEQEGVPTSPGGGAQTLFFAAERLARLQRPNSRHCDLSWANPRGNAHQSRQQQTGTTATPSSPLFTLRIGGPALLLRKLRPRQRKGSVPQWGLVDGALRQVAVAEEGGGALSAAGIYAVLKRFFGRAAAMASEAGLEARRFETASTHWMRHTFARQSLVDGAPLEVVCELMGHASIDTTSI